MNTTQEPMSTTTTPLSNWITIEDSVPEQISPWDPYEGGFDIPLVTQIHEPTVKIASFVVADEDIWKQLCAADNLNPNKNTIHTIEYYFDPTYAARQQLADCGMNSPAEFNEDDVSSPGYVFQLLEAEIPAPIEGRTQTFIGHKETLARFESLGPLTFLFDWDSIPQEYRTVLNIATAAANYTNQ